LILLISNAEAEVEFIEHTIAQHFSRPRVVQAIDMDSDNDPDIISCSNRHGEIAWWENCGGDEFRQHTVTDNLLDVYDIYAIDLDGDEDVDVLSASYNEACILWWENDGDQQFEEHEVQYNFVGAYNVYGADLDNDDDVDIVASANIPGELYWWENDGNQEFTDYFIQRSWGSCEDLILADMDRDRDIDIVASSNYLGELHAWNNDGHAGFSHWEIYDFGYTPKRIHVVDFDDDRANDVIVAYRDPNDQDNDRIYICEYSQGRDFLTHLVGAFPGAFCVSAGDFDCDGDMDIVSGSYYNRRLSWWSNLGDYDFQEYEIGDRYRSPYSVATVDIDDDLDDDIISCSYYGGLITLWENLSEDQPQEFNLTYPPPCTTLSVRNTTLCWETAVEQDRGDSVFYEVWVGYEPDLSDAICVRQNNRGTEYRFENLDDDRRYYWTVKARDTNTEGRWANDTCYFSICVPEPPRAFRAIGPPDDAEVPRDHDFPIMFRWERAVDPDSNDTVSYDLCLSIYTDFEENNETIDTGDTCYYILDYLEDCFCLWRVKATDTQGHIRYSEGTKTLVVLHPNSTEAGKGKSPLVFVLHESYPNPFNSTTTISIGLAASSELKLNIFNISGQQVAVLANERYSPDYHQFIFNADELPSGIYFIHASVPGKMDEVRKVVLIR